jgi:hypothetical protein
MKKMSEKELQMWRDADGGESPKEMRVKENQKSMPISHPFQCGKSFSTHWDLNNDPT